MNESTKRILWWTITGLIIVGAFFAVILSSRGGGGGTVGEIPAVKADEWMKGNKDATVELVEYSDFQCPACATQEPMIKKLIGEFGGHMKFVYRHFPLNIHPNAKISAQAAEAAGIQGKFWEMHGKIFENQTVWESMSYDSAKDAYVSYALMLGIDTTKFKEDLESSAVINKVSDAEKSALKSGINSTPSFFLNGSPIHPKNYDEFRQTIRDAVQNS